MQQSKKRIEWVDYLKAFACFLVILGHLIQSLQKAGIDNYDNITSFINWFIYLFHMPLFMCMSGFLFCKTKKEFNPKNYGKFVLKKSINLAVPYFTFYLIYLGLNILFSSSVNDAKGKEELLGIFNNPMPPYWFLYALLSIFIVIPLIEKIFNNNRYLTLTLLIILKIISVFFLTPVYFINSIMTYGIYFYIGCFIKEKWEMPKYLCALETALYLIASILIYKFNDSINKYLMSFIKIGFAVFGILILVQIFQHIKKSKILDTFKKYTFQIFVLHTIFAAGIRIVLLKLGVTNYIVHFAVGILFSIYVPVLISIISERIKYTDFFFFPTKTIEDLHKKRENK